MDTKSVAVPIAGILGMLSALLGFAAEATVVKRSIPDIKNNRCIHPDSPASNLGLLSLLALVVAMILIHVVSGCFCCYRSREYPPPTTPRSQCNVSLVCFIFSWVTFVTAIILLIGAASISTKENMDKLYRGSYNSFNNTYWYYCYTVKSGVFATAACLSFASVGLGITYSINMDSGMKQGASESHIAYQGGGIAMGQAQVPHPSGFVYQQT